eukprot:6203733-Pleurochrysis_carterae.AAC.1
MALLFWPRAHLAWPLSGHARTLTVRDGGGPGGYTHTLTRTLEHMQARSHARSHTRTLARTLAHTHTRSHVRTLAHPHAHTHTDSGLRRRVAAADLGVRCGLARFREASSEFRIVARSELALRICEYDLLRSWA